MLPICFGSDPFMPILAFYNHGNNIVLLDDVLPNFPFLAALFHVKTRVSRSYFLNDLLWKDIFAVTSIQTPSKLIHLTIFITLRPFTQFQPKIRATKL